jgi:hypothetical protein
MSVIDQYENWRKHYLAMAEGKMNHNNSVFGVNHSSQINPTTVRNKVQNKKRSTKKKSQSTVKRRANNTKRRR